MVGLEMDAERMTLLAFDTLPSWAMALSLTVHLLAGIATGSLHLGTLWWTTRRFARAGGAMTAAALMAARFAVLGGVLLFASREGALPLVAMALGIFTARAVMVRRLRMAGP